MTQLDIAIIGMACIYPGAPDVEAFWRNIVNGVDAITEMPANRVDALFYDPESNAADRIYTRRGGFIDQFADFDAMSFGVMPMTATTVDPDHMLALRVAESALADAGYLERTKDRERTSIILGRGGYVGPGMMRWISEVVIANQVVESLRDVIPGLTEEQLAGVKREFQSRTGISGADSAVGLIPNLVASRVANRFDFGGSAYTLDAACASSLLAVDRACKELADDQADMALAGGVHVSDTATFWTGFSQLRALSRTEQIRPFDRHADGLLIGEGIGMLALKRRADAERDGDRIYAVIRGSGIASDGHAAGLFSPRVEGQVLALERAWRMAKSDPATVGLIEAHGTAMVAGDAAEVETLRRVFGPADRDRARAGLGSVKSMIGHTMPAAGAAGLIKAALAVYHGVLPPSLHCEEEHEGLRDTRFRVIHEAEDWNADLRRAAVNAFGFGGINAHVVMDAPQAASRPASRRSWQGSGTGSRRIRILAAESQAELVAALQRHNRSGGSGPWRIAITNPTPERIASAVQTVERGRERSGRDGIFFSPGGVLTEGGKIAFLFPGVDAVFDPDLEEVAQHFGLPMPQVLDASKLELQGFGVFLVNLLCDQVIEKLGVKPDVIAGHSIGEWSGMVAAGILDRSDIEHFVQTTLASESLIVPDVSYLAVGASAERAAGALEAFHSLSVSHDNCDHQSILCGPDDEISQAADALRTAGIICEILPFRSGFHSPAFEPYVERHLRLLDELPIRAATVPLWSATTCEPYPDDPDAIRRLFGDHLVQPVHFRPLLRKLYEEENVRVFVQMGAGRLTSFVDDVLIGKRHVAVSLAASGVPGMDQLVRAAAELFVAGADIDLEALGIPMEAKPRPGVKLDLSTRLIHLDTSLGPIAGDDDKLAAGEDPLLNEFSAGVRALIEAQREVATAFAQKLPANTSPPPRPAAVTAPAAAAMEPAPRAKVKVHRRISVQEYPELLDHCLIPQAEDWPDLIDRRPTAPMTMLLELMAEAALEVSPGHVVTRIEQIIANTWLYAEPALDLEIEVEALDHDRYKVTLGEYASGVIVLGDSYPEHPEPRPADLKNERPFSLDIATCYRDNWLFHGVRYQGLKSFDAMADNGIRGQLTSLSAKGGLLDNAGQIYGMWIATKDDVGRIAMPLRIRSVAFFEPEPKPGETVECRTWIRQANNNLVSADLDLLYEGRVCTRIEAWDDWLFETRGRLYQVYRFPHKSLLAEPHPAGFTVVQDPGWLSTTLDFLTKRYLSVRERAKNPGVDGSRHFTEWLCGRIAAKDAVRRLLFEGGRESMYPAEIEITSDEEGRPLVATSTGRDIRVSLAHKKGIAVAIAAEGQTPGIDVEHVEPRSDAFNAMSFHPEELAMIPEQDRDVWLTRLWCAKEAVGKATGQGLAGNPKTLRVHRIENDSLLVEERWVDTDVLGEFVVAWVRQ